MATKKITLRSSKQEIMDEYERIMNELKQEKSKDKTTPEIIETPKQEKIKETKKLTVENLIENMSQNKVTLINLFEELTNKVIDKKAEFDKIEESINIAKSYLGDLNVVADSATFMESLNAMVENKKIECSNQVEELESDTAKKEAEYKASLQEKLNQSKKEFDRNLEELQYEYNLKRRNYKQSYDEEIAELKAIVNEYTEKKEYFENLENQIACIDDRIKSAVREAEAILKNKLEKDYNHKQALANLETKNEIELKDMKIKELTENNVAQKELITELKDNVASLNKQVQEIATSAINSTAQRPNVLNIKPDNK